jgi:membrane protease YdiL (CAAX protease family)
MATQPSEPLKDSCPFPSDAQAGNRPPRRIVAALVLCLLAAAGVAANYIASVRRPGGVEMTRDQQARMAVFTGRLAMGLAYYLDGWSRDETLARPNREFARTYARIGFKSAGGYFDKAARNFPGVNEKTAAAASAAGLYAAAGDDWRAVLVLQETMQGAPIAAPAGSRSARVRPDHGPPTTDHDLTPRGRSDILLPLLRMYANERPRPALLRSAAFRWVKRHAAARLLIAAQINERLGRAGQAAHLRNEMYAVGERIATRMEIILALAVVAFLLGLGILAWGALRRGGFGPYQGLPARPWGPWAGLTLVGGWLTVYLAISAVAQVEPGRPGFAASALASYVLASAVALAWFARFVARGGGLATVGWLRASLATSLSNGVGAYVAVFPIVAATTLLAMRLLPPSPPNAVIVTLTQPGWGARGWLLVLLCIAAPVVEETVFRGALYGGLRTRWSLPAAALASSAVFAAVHINLQTFIPIVALGACLCVVYERTRSLVPGMVAHSLFNLATVIVVLVLA